MSFLKVNLRSNTAHHHCSLFPQPQRQVIQRQEQKSLHPDNRMERNGDKILELKDSLFYIIFQQAHQERSANKDSDTAATCLSKHCHLTSTGIP